LRLRTVRPLGARTAMWLPLVKGDSVIGALAIYRQEVRPFTEQQIRLVQTFADQAVIAIENARLFNETKEALERQTATTEILKVISNSPTNTQPVFDEIAKNAMRVLGGISAVVTRRVGDALHLVGYTATSKRGDEYIKSIFPLSLSDEGRSHSIVARTRTPFNLVDSEAAGVPATVRDAGRFRGFRSQLTVPMLREDEAIGTISVTGREPGS